MQLGHCLATENKPLRPVSPRRSFLERAFWKVWSPVDRLVQDVGRDLSFLISKASATYLPSERALQVARLLSWCFPINGASRAAVRKTFGVDSTSAQKIVSGHRFTPYRDYVLTRRLFTGSDPIVGYPYREENVEIVRGLRDSGASYIIAIGHFSRISMLPLYLPCTVPQEMTGLIAPSPPHSWKPGVLWKRLLLGQMLIMLCRVRPDLQLVHPGSLAAIKGIVRRLRSGGNVVLTSADAHWHQTEKCHTRPFLGHPMKSFSHGAAWMARMAQCPIVVCMPHLDETGKAVLDWRVRLDPPAKDDEAADERITKQLIDEVEAAVYRHPEQYVLDLTPA